MPALLLQPTPVEKVAEVSPVAIKGQIAEVFGNKKAFGLPTPLTTTTTAAPKTETALVRGPKMGPVLT